MEERLQVALRGAKVSMRLTLMAFSAMLFERGPDPGRSIFGRHFCLNKECLRVNATDERMEARTLPYQKYLLKLSASSKWRHLNPLIVLTEKGLSSAHMDQMASLRANGIDSMLVLS